MQQTEMQLDDWLRARLRCPRDVTELTSSGDELRCARGHTYPIHLGIPIMLVDDVPPTHGAIGATLARVARPDEAGPACDGTAAGPGSVDDFVQAEIPYTSGNLYFSVQHALERYPIPELRLDPGAGRRLLDIGCNWGRWSIAAASLGYRPVGIDPSLEALLAARRVCRQVGVEADFVVGDARCLPFDGGAFDVVFSYGVLQHFAKHDARTSLAEVQRVLAAGGTSLIQMPNRYGIRQMQQRRRLRGVEGDGFEVRYWRPSELVDAFEELVGPSVLSADCYFGLGLQGNDVDLLPRRFRAVVRTSELLRRASRRVRPLRLVADSVYLASSKAVAQ